MQIDYHKTLEDIQSDPEGLTAIQYLQSRGLSGYLFPVPLTPIPLEMIKLSSEESKLFVDAINNPPAPSENLQKAASNYSDEVLVH